jgi:glycosyltransferase involved in cell wall biosynthesis
MSFDISVIICTHNPRIDYLESALIALKEQSLHVNDWELIIVDNNSKVPIADKFNLSWHPFGRYEFEEKLGLAYARIKGIKEANGEFIIFIDDDNCLKPNYLEVALQAMRSFPLLGALGAGKIIPKYEVEPSMEVVPYLRSLAIRDEIRPTFSNEVKYHKATPFGAGLCVRRSIGLAYIKTCLKSTIATSLGRVGNVLLSGEDIDLALHACRDNYLSGVMPELELVHLIPKTRLDHKYLVKIAAGHAASTYILSQLWQFDQYPEDPIIKWGRYWKKRIKAKGLEREILIAEHRAEKAAKITWKKFNS